MEAQKVIAEIKKSLAQVEQSGQDIITVEALKQYLDALADALGQTVRKSDEIDVKLVEYAHERNLAYYNAVQPNKREMLRAVFAYSQTALKSTLLINGGAAAAVLAFIGNVWDSKLSAATASGLTNSILLFALGVLSAAVGTGFTYCTQYCYTEEWKKGAIAFHILTLLAVLAAFCLFGFGVYEAYSGFSEHLSSNPAY